MKMAEPGLIKTIITDKAPVKALKMEEKCPRKKQKRRPKKKL
jgi:hypothetical protein